MTEKAASKPKETGRDARGRLAQGVPGLDISAAARTAGTVRTCGAAPRGERAHHCRNLAMGNGRCWLHGGRSTGPRTADGLARAQRASWKHGERSAKVREERRRFHNLMRAVTAELAELERGVVPGEELVADADTALRMMRAAMADAPG